MNINEAIEKISSSNDLEKEEIKKVFLSIMKNECNDAEIISFLMTLKTKGESVEEITGAAEVLREMSQKLELPSDNLVDTDLSGEAAEVSAVCNAVWTSDVKAALKAKLIADKSS